MLDYGVEVVPAKKTLRGNELDMRVSPLIGSKLYDLIIESVKATQVGVILKELPNWITLSHKQFVSLETNIEEMENTKLRIFYTPYNVMEVEVDEDFDRVNTDHIIQGGESTPTREEFKNV